MNDTAPLLDRDPDSTQVPLSLPDSGPSPKYSPCTELDDRLFATDGATSCGPFEHFEADVARLGVSAPPASESMRGFLTRLANEIDRTASAIDRPDDPTRRIQAIVDHCTSYPSQEKIEAGATILSSVPERFATFVERWDDRHDATQHDNHIWLFANAMSFRDDFGTDTRQRFVTLLCRWLRINDPSVRESAANALGALGAIAAAGILEEVMRDEPNSIVREAIEDALTDIGSH